MNFINDRAYLQIHIGSQIIAHQVTTRLGHHWRHAVLSQERNGVQVDYGVFCFSTRAPQVILPIEAMKGFKGRVMKERYGASS
jgi:hypothetical protein